MWSGNDEDDGDDDNADDVDDDDRNDNEDDDDDEDELDWVVESPTELIRCPKLSSSRFTALIRTFHLSGNFTPFYFSFQTFYGKFTTFYFFFILIWILFTFQQNEWAFQK